MMTFPSIIMYGKKKKDYPSKSTIKKIKDRCIASFFFSDEIRQTFVTANKTDAMFPWLSYDIKAKIRKRMFVSNDSTNQISPLTLNLFSSCRKKKVVCLQRNKE